VDIFELDVATVGLQRRTDDLDALFDLGTHDVGRSSLSRKIAVACPDIEPGGSVRFRRMRTFRRWTIIPAVTLALTLAACGSDDDSSSSAGSTPPSAAPSTPATSPASSMETTPQTLPA